jgi:hypothetical protein
LLWFQANKKSPATVAAGLSRPDPLIRRSFINFCQYALIDARYANRSASVMPEQRKKNDDRQRDSQKPK